MGLKKIKILFFILLLLISLLYLKFLRDINLPYKNYQGRKIIKIKKNSGLKRISKKLYKSGIVKSWKTFFLLVKLLRKDRYLKSGYYVFERPLSILEVEKILEKGPNFFIKFKIREGENFFDISKKAENNKLLRAKNFIKLYRATYLIEDITKDAKNLEGYLFPDTYFFPPEYTSTEMVKKMIENFRKKAILVIKKYHREKEIHKIITIASLIEKETSSDIERKLISSVFYNRLKINMKLQCDPTVIYAKILSGKSFDGKIYKSDLKRKSPYNTYYKKGLPPGPICNPGIKSIIAACNPAKTDYLYFVSMNNGHHFFSENIKKHVKAVEKYQRKRKR